LARTPEFDEDQVLEAAQLAFWRKGYEATSLSDLLEATGLARQSLYNTFGDKHGLFLASLRRYVDKSVAVFSKVLETGPVRSAIRRAFEKAINAVNAECGCFLVNSATEMMPRDPEVARLAASALAGQERVLAEALRRGVREGELHLTPKRIEQTARFLVSTLQGLQVMVKATRDSAALQDTLNVALRAID
jgi:TetR/AcrR family transcriptional repressor of nem operon